MYSSDNRVIFFYENRNLTISLSCFRYCNGILYPQDKIPKLYSGQVLQPDLCYFPSPLLHCAYPLLSQHHTSATLASLQFLECIHPSQVFFEQKSLFLIFSKPVQIFCPSNLSSNTTPAGKFFLSLRLGWMPPLLILTASCTFI